MDRRLYQSLLAMTDVPQFVIDHLMHEAAGEKQLDLSTSENCSKSDDMRG